MTSEEEFEAKFPGQKPDGIPPSPTPENPGQVYPLYDIQDGTYHQCLGCPSCFAGQSYCPEHIASNSDTSHRSCLHSREATAASNPFLLRSALSKLHQCLTDTISVLESDESANATCLDRSDEEENPLLEKLRMWRQYLDGIHQENFLVDSSRPQSSMPPTVPIRSTTNGYRGQAPGSGIFSD